MSRSKQSIAPDWHEQAEAVRAEAANFRTAKSAKCWRGKLDNLRPLPKSTNGLHRRGLRGRGNSLFCYPANRGRRRTCFNRPD
jgi:hypothetical protein